MEHQFHWDAAGPSSTTASLLCSAVFFWRGNVFSLGCWFSLRNLAMFILIILLAPGLRQEVEGDGHGGLLLTAPWLFSSRPTVKLYRFAVQVFSLCHLLWLHVLR